MLSRAATLPRWHQPLRFWSKTSPRSCRERYRGTLVVVWYCQLEHAIVLHISVDTMQRSQGHREGMLRRLIELEEVHLVFVLVYRHQGRLKE